MKKAFVFLLSIFLTASVFGQRYFTENGKINFDATSPSSPERVEAVNRSVTCVVDLKT